MREVAARESCAKARNEPLRERVEDIPALLTHFAGQAAHRLGHPVSVTPSALAALTQYGVNLVRLQPGTWSSQRHWHIAQDEFIYVLSGELTLVTNAGAEILRAGDCAGFKAGDENGHHLQNNSSAEATFLEIGTRLAHDGTFYSDIDMMLPPGTREYRHRDGRPYPKQERRGP